MELVIGATAKGIAQWAPVGLVEGVSVTGALCEDARRGTTRNTSEAAIGAITGTAASFEGFRQGMTYGQQMLPCMPVAGPLIGGAVGSMFATVVGEQLGKAGASQVFDGMKYDCKVFECKKCGVRFWCRVYKDQSRLYCSDCDPDKVRGLAS